MTSALAEEAIRFIRPRGTAPGPDFISLKNGTALPATAGHKMTKATCRQADDSRTDGIGATRLSFPTVGFHIDCLAVNHPEVASDANSLARLFLTDYCKALSRAVLCKDDFHCLMKYSGLRARNGFSSTPSAFSKKTGYPPRNEKNTLLSVQHRELAFSQPLNHLYDCKCKKNF